MSTSVKLPINETPDEKLFKAIDDATTSESDELEREGKLYHAALDLKASEQQIGGDHYKGCKIEPHEYIHANNIGFHEGNAIKYLTRWRGKGGLQDLEKARHFIDLLIEMENKYGER